ncbi:hypothetical protein [uncultured Sphingomonas sp.]|uniref:hypothetical protein n=1 Tax=uncultured Sphingomonas sp. TaxID=158754 RepID=UPI0035CA9103
MNPRLVITDSYLQRIQIAVAAGDHAAPFRDFLDNWHAFEHGPPFITKGLRPIWFNNPCAWQQRDMLNAMHFVSADAREVLDRAKADTANFIALRMSKDASTRLVVDHAIPLRVLRQRVFEDRALADTDALKAYLKSHYRLAVITHAEDQRLNRLKLRSAMPGNWDGQNTWARYEAAGIV